MGSYRCVLVPSCDVDFYGLFGAGGYLRRTGLPSLGSAVWSPEAERCPQATIRAVVMALLEQRVDAAVVPVENSVEGGVTSCSDCCGNPASRAMGSGH